MRSIERPSVAGPCDSAKTTWRRLANELIDRTAVILLPLYIAIASLLIFAYGVFKAYTSTQKLIGYGLPIVAMGSMLFLGFYCMNEDYIAISAITCTIIFFTLLINDGF